jgi:hypothetical protein
MGEAWGGLFVKARCLGPHVLSLCFSIVCSRPHSLERLHEKGRSLEAVGENCFLPREMGVIELWHGAGCVL